MSGSDLPAHPRPGLEPGEVKRGRIPFARRADGGEAWFPLIEARGPRAGPVLTVTAGVHGDEYEGVRAIHRLAAGLDPAQLAGTLRLVPIVHLAAFEAGTRTSPVDGLNLARVFPGDSKGTQTLRLAEAVMTNVVEGSDVLVDLHSGGTRLAFAAVAGFYGEDDEIARALRMPALWRLPGRAGVLSYEAHRRDVAVAGCEAGGRGGCLESDVTTYHHGLLALMHHLRMLDGEPPPLPETTALLDGDWQLSPVGGLIESHVEVGDRVDEGALLATLRDPFGDTVQHMHAPFRGFVMGVRHLCSVQPGEWATCVVHESRA